MADDSYARSVQVLISLVGNPEERLDTINQKLDQLSGKKFSVGSDNSIQQLSGKAKEAGNSVNNISNAGKQVESSLTSSFSKIKGSIDEVHGGIQNLIASMAGIAIGGSIAGLSYKDAAASKLYTEQTYKAIDATKQFKNSRKEVEELVASATGTGYVGSSSEVLGAIKNTMIKASETYKGTGADKKMLALTEAALQVGFSVQESYSGGGEGLVNLASQKFQAASSRRGKEQRSQFVDALTAAGVENLSITDSRLDSTKKKYELILEAQRKLAEQPGGFAKQIDDRPWDQASKAIDDLKKAIGVGLIPVMTPLIKGFTTLIQLITSIPGIPTLIGLAAAGLTLVSTITLLNGVLSPGWKLIKELFAWTQKDTVATLANAEAKTVQAGAARTATTANRGLAISEGLVLSPLLIAAGIFIIIGGLLYLLESRTGVFSKALKQLGETEMGQDLIQWFKDVGYWIDEGAKGLGSFLGDSITQVNELYKGLKSGTGTNISNTLTIGLGVILGPFGLLVPILRNSMPIIQSETKIISDAITYIKNLLDEGWKTITGIYSKLTDFVEKMKALPGDIANAIKNLAGYGETSGTTPQIADAAKELSKDVTKDTTDQQLSDMSKTKALELYPGYEEKDLGGISGDIYNYLKYMRDYGNDQKTIDRLLSKLSGHTPTPNEVKAGANPNAGTPTNMQQFAPGIETGGEYSQNVDRSVAMQNDQGENRPSIWNLFGSFASGGLISRSGLAMVHSGEPIIPAEVASSSRLQNVLESIASGNNTTTNQGDIKVNINYTAPSGNSSGMIVMDKWSFEKLVADVVAQKLRQLNGC